MAKSIMISGPHAIGKTTTAEELANKLGYLFIGSVASIVAKKLKFDIDKNFNPIDISKYQYEILNGLQFVYDATKYVDTIADRSPLDSAVYLTLALEGETDFYNVVGEYRQTCLDMINQTCNVLILPEADLEGSYEEKFGRPKFTEHQKEYRKRYQQELDSLVKQISPDIRVIRVPIEKQFSDRTSFILNELERVSA